MSFSDFILAILVLVGIACVIWILDLNPYSKQLQIYSQTCDNMILENTYCKGNWQDNPIETFIVTHDAAQVSFNLENQSDSVVYEDCEIQDRKNWACTDELTQQNITVKDGLVIYAENNDRRQITRLQWLQNKALEFVN